MLKDIAVLRRHHSVYSEIKGARGEAGLAHGSIENAGRDLMTKPARADEDRVEIIPMLLEKPEIGTQDVNLGKRKQCIQASAAQDENERCNPGI